MGETFLDPLSIRFSQDTISEHFKDDPEMSICDTFEKITAGMQKREVPMMHVVRRMDGQLVTLDNRRLAVYKMARRAGGCGNVKLKLVPMEQVKNELRHKSDSKVDGLSVKVRGTDRIIHAGGSVTRGPALSDGQLQHRADTGGHWSQEQLAVISKGIVDFEAVVKSVLGASAKLMKAGSFMKGTDIAGESDIDVMVFGCGASPISEYQWNSIVSGIKQRGYTIDGVNPRCIHVKVERAGNCLVTIEFDVVAHHRQGFPPNKEPNNPFRENRVAARAVRNIKLDFKESGEKGFSGNDIEQAVLDVQEKCSPGLGMLIDAAKAELKSGRLRARKRPATAARENDASFERSSRESTPSDLGLGRRKLPRSSRMGQKPLKAPSLLTMLPCVRSPLKLLMPSTRSKSSSTWCRSAKLKFGLRRRPSNVFCLSHSC